MSSVVRKVFSRRTLAIAAGGTAVAAGGGYWYLNSGPAYPQSTRETRRAPPPWTPPSRAEMLASLKVSRPLQAGAAAQGEEFDLLIVGGGATGAGVAVDAASRGLKVALVERDDFGAGTSSKSTKLVHGGVRYLQKAVMELDYDQYKLVKEALHERKIFLQTAPYLSHMLPIMLPIYQYWQVPYYWAGCKLYDVLAGKENMESSYLMSRGKALETFPMLKQDGLVGALVYYDGQHNDSRMNIALIMTAVKLGAVVGNYCEVTDLHKDESGKLHGARLKDNLTGEEWNVRAKGIINATGPFSDTLLKLDNPSHTPIVQPSSGIHITLPNYYSPRKMGLLDPATSDGRVIFFLPWQGNTIAGTTDTPASVERNPVAPEEEIRWVLEEVRRYLSPDIRVRRGDVLSAWSGLRPLVRNPAAASTQGLVRSHMIYVSESGLLTIAGGKWTTYREMAQETVDTAIKTFNLQNKVRSGCVTENLRLVGSDGWSRNMFIGLIQRYGLETDVAKHLSDNYGDRAWTVCSLAEPTGRQWPLYGKRISAQYPYIEAEVRYAVNHEYAQTAIDVLARRTRLCFLNVQAALETLPRVVDIMADELGWSYTERKKQIADAVEFFGSMGLPRAAVPVLPPPIPRTTLERLWAWLRGSRHSVYYARTPKDAGVVSHSRARFEPGELAALTAAFDRHAKSMVVDGQPEEVIELPRVVPAVREVAGYEGVSAKDFDYVLEEAGLKKAEGLGFDEFIEICGNLKDVVTAPAGIFTKRERFRIPVEKSGGGV
ncbi:putative FAD-dependent glycerol-3-phosphate dehydrogenase family protein [Lyophyllum shimeji]|uniref:Glycerol-3-phosphate dehydrogenase n=1 Tax=Lyophyllum shimeji TaxID=47721 RepID=A0A9P3PMT0_LYOSH|nr:putative FAD-dependent glycerol-3-phosphate dehydrogenase family protein [Lyophyllum shimeji]